MMDSDAQATEPRIVAVASFIQGTTQAMAQ